MSIITNKISTFHIDKTMLLQTQHSSTSGFHGACCKMKGFCLFPANPQCCYLPDSLSSSKIHLFPGGKQYKSKVNMGQLEKHLLLCRPKHYKWKSLRLVHPQSVSSKLCAFPRRPQNPSSKMEFTSSQSFKKMFFFPLYHL